MKNGSDVGRITCTSKQVELIFLLAPRLNFTHDLCIVPLTRSISIEHIF